MVRIKDRDTTVFLVRDRAKFLVVKIIIPNPKIEKLLLDNLKNYLPTPITFVETDSKNKNEVYDSSFMKENFKSPSAIHRTEKSEEGSDELRGDNILGKILNDDLLSSDEEDYAHPEPSKSPIVQEYLSIKSLLKENKMLINIENGFYYYQLNDDESLPLSCLFTLKDFKDSIIKLFQVDPIKLSIGFGVFLILLVIAFTKIQTIIITIIGAGICWILSSSISYSFKTGPLSIKKTVDLSIRDNKIIEECLNDGFLEDGKVDKYIGSVISMSTQSLSKFYTIYRALFIYILKGEHRTNVTPFIKKLNFKKDILNHINDRGEEVNLKQVIVNKGRDELILVEIDQEKAQVSGFFEMRLCRQSRSICFGSYKSNGNKDLGKLELLGLIDQIRRLSKNPKMVKKALGKAYYEKIEYISDSKTAKNIVTQNTEPARYSAGPILQNLKPNHTKGERIQTRERSRILPESLTKEFQQIQEVQEEKLNHRLEKEGANLNSPRKVNSEIVPIRDDNQMVESPQKPLSTFQELPDTFPEELKELYFEKKKLAFDLLDLKKTPDLKESENKKGFLLHLGVADKFIIFRSEVVLDYSMEEIREVIAIPSDRPKFDKVIRKVEVLEQVSPSVIISRIIVKGKFTVSDREFITYAISTQLDPNTHMMLSFSLDPAVKDFPPTKKTVRGEIAVGMNLYKELGNGKTKFMGVAKSDPRLKGIPMSIIKNGAKDGARMPLNVIKLLDKMKKKK